MADLYDKLSDSRSLLEKIGGLIPGFSGYLERERRRDADKLLRDTIVNRYGEQLSRISRLQTQLLSGTDIEHVDELQDAATRLQRFIDMVKTAAYGYAGFFNRVKVNEAELAKMYAFDVELLENVAKVASAVDNVEASVGSDGLPAAIRHLVTLVADCNTAFERRKEVLTS